MRHINVLLNAKAKLNLTSSAGVHHVLSWLAAELEEVQCQERSAAVGSDQSDRRGWSPRVAQPLYQHGRRQMWGPAYLHLFLAGGKCQAGGNVYIKYIYITHT